MASRNVKIYSTSLIKTTMRYYFIPVRGLFSRKEGLTVLVSMRRKENPPTVLVGM